jgi:hypothetical protein
MKLFLLPPLPFNLSLVVLFKFQLACLLQINEL